MLIPRLSYWPIDSGSGVVTPGVVFDLWLSSSEVHNVAARIEEEISRHLDRVQSPPSPHPLLIARAGLAASERIVGDCELLLAICALEQQPRLPVWADRRSIRPSAWEAIHQLLINDEMSVRRAPEIPAREGELRTQVSISGTPDSPPRLRLVLQADPEESRRLASRLRRTSMEFKKAETNNDADEHTHIALALAINGLDVGKSELTIHVALPSGGSMTKGAQPPDGRGWKALAEHLLSELRSCSQGCDDSLRYELECGPFWAGSTGR